MFYKISADSIAENVLQKIARTRATAELLKFLEKKSPGFSQYIKGRTTGEVGQGMMVLPAELRAYTRQMRRRTPISQKNLEAHPLWKAHSASLRGSYEPWRQTRDPHYLKRLASGRHAPRAGEAVVPEPVGDIEPFEMAMGVPVSRKYLFRGNPVLEKSKAFLASHHPGIAGEYALMGAFTNPSRRLFAFSPKGMQARTTAADVYNIVQRRGGKLDSAGYPPMMFDPDSSVRSLLPMYKRQQLGDLMKSIKRRKVPIRELSHLPRNPYYNTTYETVVRGNRMPQPVGEYNVRRSRTPSGMPGLALKTISGAPAEQLFKPYMVR